MRVDTRPQLNNKAGGLSYTMSKQVLGADLEAEQQDVIQSVRGRVVCSHSHLVCSGVPAHAPWPSTVVRHA